MNMVDDGWKWEQIHFYFELKKRQWEKEDSGLHWCDTGNTNRQNKKGKAIFFKVRSSVSNHYQGFHDK